MTVDLAQKNVLGRHFESVSSAIKRIWKDLSDLLFFYEMKITAVPFSFQNDEQGPEREEGHSPPAANKT